MTVDSRKMKNIGMTLLFTFSALWSVNLYSGKAAVTIDVGNIGGVINDVRAALATEPADAPTFDIYTGNFQGLIADLKSAGSNLPTNYQNACSTPFSQFLTGQLGQTGYNQVFSGPPQDNLSATLQALIPDISLAILLHGKNAFSPQASAAFQEMIADLYDGFLSKERTNKALIPPREVLPPLVKWGNPDAGPYTFPIDATSILGLKAAIVSLPPSFAIGGLVAWVSLGHETAGHDVCHAYPTLLSELKTKVMGAVLKQFHSPALAHYWGNCIDEAVSDVCGTLNMGPTAGLGLIAFFRGMMPDGKLRAQGSADDPHPIDVLRGFMAAKLVAELGFADASKWSQIIYNESMKDLGNRKFSLVDENTGRQMAFPVNNDIAIQSAYLVAATMANVKLEALGNHSFKEIQNWTDADQAIANNLGQALRSGSALPNQYAGAGFYATHVVAAAVQESFKTGADIKALFQNMISYLSQMNSQNPEWAKKAA